MSRPLWVRPTGRHEQVAGAALEAGADGVLVPTDRVEEVEGVGRLPLAPLDGDTVDLAGADARVVEITGPEDQEEAEALIGGLDTLIVRGTDWSIIPLENLIAWAQDTRTTLLAEVTSPKQAEVALTTLEAGADGLVLATDDPARVHEVGELAAEHGGGTLDLVEATVTSIEDAGMGDRVCVDTTSLLEPDEGLLVGSRSAFLALVASEAREAGYVDARPFRVNAGAVHAYALAPGDETRYLSEVRAGTPLLAVGAEGATRRVVTGRAKVERRPMLLVELEGPDGGEGTLVLQNAETIRLVTADGVASVAELEPGDAVLAHPAHEGGRHFGTAIDETVREV
jgi:3-dehydroquinate synthase II